MTNKKTKRIYRIISKKIYIKNKQKNQVKITKRSNIKKKKIF